MWIDQHTLQWSIEEDRRDLRFFALVRTKERTGKKNEAMSPQLTREEANERSTHQNDHSSRVVPPELG